MEFTAFLLSGDSGYGVWVWFRGSVLGFGFGPVISLQVLAFGFVAAGLGFWGLADFGLLSSPIPNF